MLDFIISVVTQSITFIPLAFAISISYHLLRATDMTIDGSFVAGAGIFAKLIILGLAPIFAAIVAVCGGMLCGIVTACIQRSGRIDALLSGIITVFMLSSINLLLMGKPNINLLNETTLVSTYFQNDERVGWMVVSGYIALVCISIYFILSSRLGLTLRALGDNPLLLKRLGHPIEHYRAIGFAITNGLAASAGVFTAQTVGYADINMGFGMTLTGIGAIILGEQCLRRFIPNSLFRMHHDLLSCLIGVSLYFSLMNLLLRIDINPTSLKLVLGLILIFFLRTAMKSNKREIPA